MPAAAAAAGGGKKAYAVAIAIQVIYTGMFVISKAAFDHGFNTFVFTFYRQAAGSLLLLPIALLRHRNDYARSMPSPMLLFKIFTCTLIGTTFSTNLYNVSLKFTSATVASVADNTLPAVTFFLSLLLRMEHMKLKSLSGVAKLVGMALCLAGVLVTALYAGPSMSPVNHHHAFTSHSSSRADVVTRSAFMKWTFLMVLAIAAWSLWIVLQARLLKEYPNKMLVTVLQCVFSAVQSFVVAVVAERDFSKWILRLDISLLAILYNGFVVTGVTYYLQAWCVEMKGPVFFAVWTPLCFIFTIFSSSFFLGEIVHLGSIVGGILLVGGLYSVLWGKSKETNVAACGKVNSGVDDADEENNHHKPQEKVETTSSPIVDQI